MVIDEVFPFPTVKQVIFQIRYPNLFYIENKIGEFQTKIIEKFPESALLYRRRLVFADIGPKGKLEEIPGSSDEFVKKIWQFRSEKKYELNVSSNSLDITSEYHKTYNLDGADKFRDIIDFVLRKFFEVVSIPIINRIGLRYIDECPLPSKDNKTFRSYYNSVFPIERFRIEDAREMLFRVVTQKGKFYLNYMESLRKVKGKYKLILDFDGYTTKIRSENCLKITDKLHDLIQREYEKTIKEPVYEYMRTGKIKNV